MKAIVNGKIIVPDANENFIIKKNHAVIFDEKIRAVMPQEKFCADVDAETKNKFGLIVDAKGKYVSPGFINVHVHGCAGSDTMDEDAAALDAMRIMQAATGVTAFLPTTMTADVQKNRAAFGRVRAAMQKKIGAYILGCHAEGPFISEKYKGAQAAKNISRADFDLVKDFADTVRIITAAPEAMLDDDGGFSFIEKCRAKNILVSLGHTAADYALALRAVRAGASRTTHTFNAMTGLHHRNPGVALIACENDVNAEIIADNVHVHPAMQRLLFRAKGGEKIVLVTDSMRACGAGDGMSELGGQKVIVNGSLATLEDGTIAGSVLTMNEAVANFCRNTRAPLEKIVEFATKTPAQELGVYDSRGALSVGKAADIVVFDESLKTFCTFVGGVDVFNRLSPQ